MISQMYAINIQRAEPETLLFNLVITFNFTLPTFSSLPNYLQHLHQLLLALLT